MCVCCRRRRRLLIPSAAPPASLQLARPAHNAVIYAAIISSFIRALQKASLAVFLTSYTRHSPPADYSVNYSPVSGQDDQIITRSGRRTRALEKCEIQSRQGARQNGRLLHGPPPAKTLIRAHAYLPRSRQSRFDKLKEIVGKLHACSRQCAFDYGGG